MRSSSSSASGSRTIFDARLDVHRPLRPGHGLITFPYDLDEGERVRARRPQARPGPDVDGHRDRATAAGRTIRERGGRRRPGRTGSATESWLGVPIPAGDRVIGVVALESLDAARVRRRRRAAAQHARVEHGRRPRERPAVRRDAPSARRDERARGGAVRDQRDRRGARPTARVPGDHRSRRRTRRDDLREPLALHRAPRPGARHPDVPVRPGRGQAVRARRVQGGFRAHVDRAEERTVAPDRVDRGADGRGRLQVGGSDTQSWLGVADPGRQPRHRRHRPREPPAGRLRRRPTSGSSTRSRRASASPSRTPGCSTRRSAFCPDGPARRRAGRHQRDRLGLAEQLDFQSIVDLVGERVRSIFDAAIVVHRALRPGDEHDRVSRTPSSRRSATSAAPRRAGPGLTSTSSRPPAPVRMGSDDEADASASSRSAARTRSRASASRSWAAIGSPAWSRSSTSRRTRSARPTCDC